MASRTQGDANVVPVRQRRNDQSMSFSSEDSYGSASGSLETGW
jgi:hypothetical protein